MNGSQIVRRSWFKPFHLCVLLALFSYDGFRASAEAEPASLSDVKRPADANSQKPPSNILVSRPYYIEFRARNAESYGHTFSIYGRLTENGKIASKTVAGLHPISESPVPWMIGHLIIVPSETGASDGDIEDQYVLSRFRVTLTASEYKKVVAYIKTLQRSSPVWHAVFNNCNGFVGDIAKFMGLETPFSTMLMPAAYIDSLRDLNISKTTGIIGTPVKVESAEELRAHALKQLARKQKRAVVEPHREHSLPVGNATPPTANHPGSERPKNTQRTPVSNLTSGRLTLHGPVEPLTR